MTNSKRGLYAVLAGVFIAGSGVAAEANGQGFVLEEIVVTARKVEENVQEIPLSISAFNTGELRQRQIRTSDQLSDVTPNLVFDAISPSSASNSSSAIFIRGIGQVDFIPTTDPGVGLYIDGVYMARSLGNTLDLMDIERIEVLRGPQGTLFGRNTIGGAVAVHSVRPNNEFSGSAEVEVGDDEKVYLTGNVNVPFSDNFYGRFNATRRTRDGYVKRVQLAERQLSGVALPTDGKDLGDDDMWGARASFVWNASDSLNFYLTADYIEEDENGAPQVSAGLSDFSVLPWLANLLGNPNCTPAADRSTNNSIYCVNDTFARDPYETEGTYPVTSQLETWSVTLEANWEVNEWVSIKSITAYRDIDSLASRDSDGTPYDVFHIQDGLTQDQFSQELQINGVVENLKWLVGAYYFEEEAHNPAPAFLGFGGGLFSGGFAENDNWALFGQATYDLTDKWALTAGIRYTEETKAFFPDQYAIGTFTIGATTDNASTSVRFHDCMTGQEPGCNGVSGRLLTDGDWMLPPVWSEAKFDDVTWTASLAYQVTDDVMVYATVADGYKAGGFDLRYVGFLPEPSSYGPEEAIAYELGMKSTWLDNTLRLNMSMFLTDYTEIHVRARVGNWGSPITINAGEAEIKGFEIEALWAPTPAWLVQAAVGHLDAEYTDVDPRVVLLQVLDTDTKLGRTPAWSGNIGVSYTHQVGGWSITPRVDWVYTDEHYNDAVNAPRTYQDSYDILNAAILVTSPDERYEIMLSGRNLTDDLYLVSANSSYGSATGYTEQTYARPWEWSLSFKYNF